MNYLKRSAQICALGILCFSCGIFKNSRHKVKGQNIGIVSVTGAKADSIKRVPSKLKPYTEIITKKAISQIGLLNVHKMEEKYFFEIPDSMMETDLLVVNRIAKGATGASKGMSGYGGDQINENVVRFSKGPNHKVFIRSVSFTERAVDSTESGMYRSMLNSGIQPIVASFDVKALSKDSAAVVIDVTDYLNADNDILFFSINAKTGMKLGGLQADKSYTNWVRAYPGNIEIRTTKTYSRTPSVSPFGGAVGGGNATYEMNSSIIRLPKRPMASRFYDDRVGYFATGYTDFDRNPQGVAQTSMITRWRLEPKDADRERYVKGDLVEPKEQIVFYIDPATPKKWVPYLIQGVNDWNVAFEAAGFKNAIVAKEAPTKAQDSTWSMEDARHNVIVYKSSAIANASGPHVHDPRTGEILETHVNWYHNVMQVLRNWYFIQASATDPKARKMRFDDELMGQLIRFVSSHEVGHTLGLRHNFGSSSTVPVEKLRDKAWVEANGHTPSIMDYARFNYVAQPEDGISEKGIFPRINDYDKWAIEWGYRWWPELPKAAERAKLNNWIIEKTSGNKRLWFGHEMDPNDPRSQNEDLGDDAMLSGTYGIKNLQRLVPHLTEWTKESNENYGNLEMMYREAVSQFKLYLGHVQKNIGGIMTTPKAAEEKGAVVVYVPKAKQKDAIAFLRRQLFETPVWLLNKEIFAKTGLGNAATISALQDEALARLLNSATLNKLNDFEAYSPASAYTMQNLLDDLRSGIFSELRSGKSISVYRRNLQKMYLDKIMNLLADAKGAPAGSGPGPDVKLTDISSVVRLQLQGLQQQIRAGASRATDKMSKAHLQDLNQRITQFLKVK